MENSRISALKNPSEFLELKKSGHKIKLSAWMTLQWIDHSSSDGLVGVTASRKVGSAVIRNKLKRWVKNSVNKEASKSIFYGKKSVFIFKPQEKIFYKKLKYREFYEIFTKTKFN